MKKNIKTANQTHHICLYRCINRIAHYVFTVGAQTTKRIRDQEKATALQTAEMVAEAPMTAAALESGKNKRNCRATQSGFRKLPARNLLSSWI